MRDRIRILAAVALFAGFGAMIGCDMPEEKKTLFKTAGPQQMDTARPNTPAAKPEQKQEQKKPQAFSKREYVNT
jgi:hypothetical protein